jgi:hypothetical protein
MDSNDARPHARHYRDRMTDTAQSKHRPKVCLGAIKAARLYQEALLAAALARGDLIELAVRRGADRRAALAALNHLADSFGLPPFTTAEVAAIDDAGP